MTSGEDNDDLSLITLFYGNDMPEAEAQEICDMLEELYPDMDIDLHFGGQPLYYFLLSVE